MGATPHLCGRRSRSAPTWRLEQPALAATTADPPSGPSAGDDRTDAEEEAHAGTLPPSQAHCPEPGRAPGHHVPHLTAGSRLERGLDPDDAWIIDTLIELKRDYLDIADPTVWPAEETAQAEQTAQTEQAGQAEQTGLSEAEHTFHVHPSLLELMPAVLLAAEDELGRE